MLLNSVELCAGAGGAALGLEQAGFQHSALVENDKHACETLRHNRPAWNVVEGDIREVSGAAYEGTDLLSAGPPCPPFSVAGRRLGVDDDRNLFPEILRLTEEIGPRAVMFENVKGLLEAGHEPLRKEIVGVLKELGMTADWYRLDAKDFGVPQLRPRVVLVGLQEEYWERFEKPQPTVERPVTVGEALLDEMSSGGWKGAAKWAKVANTVAPTLVGGSKKHGGPDLGPTRAKAEWAELGVDGKLIAEEPPGPKHEGMPRLTVKMAAIIQGFPPDWEFVGRKTPAYRQVGNAFPPPVARAMGLRIRDAISEEVKESRSGEAAA